MLPARPRELLTGRVTSFSIKYTPEANSLYQIAAASGYSLLTHTLHYLCYLRQIIISIKQKNIMIFKMYVTNLQENK